jgi:hypothetical protein
MSDHSNELLQIIQNEQEQGREHLAEMANISSLGLGLLDGIERNIQIDRMNSSFPLSPLAKPSKAFVQLAISFDNNLIQTPADFDYNTNSRVTEMYGYSLGAFYSKRFSAVELETGLSYSSFNKPWNFSMQYGNSNGWFSYVLTNIHYDIVSIPLSVRKHFVENVDWSIYGSVGISNEMIVASKYESVSSYLGGGAIPVGSVGDIPEILESPFEKERYFTTGLLEGESFSNAYFMRLLLEGGIQRNMTESLSICFSGSYYRTLVNSAIGPNSDRLDKFAIKVGIKKRIN